MVVRKYFLIIWNYGAIILYVRNSNLILLFQSRFLFSRHFLILSVTFWKSNICIRSKSMPATVHQEVFAIISTKTKILIKHIFVITLKKCASVFLFKLKKIINYLF